MENLLEYSWPLNLQFVVNWLMYDIKKQLNRHRVTLLDKINDILHITHFSEGMRLQDTVEGAREECELQIK